MKIFAIGNATRLAELKIKFKDSSHTIHYIDMEDPTEADEFESYDLIIDLNLDDQPEDLLRYAEMAGKPVMVCSVKEQLAEMVFKMGDELQCTLIGMNALPGFINRPKMELSLYNRADADKLKALCEALGWEYLLVDDRVGMITPRIVFMIINEACYTLQEGTASALDIDESMKLGVNYPFGPFEWCDKIGIEDVFETLEALYYDTHDERYKICSLMKTTYLRGEKFLS